MHNNQQGQILPTGESLCSYLEEEKTYWVILFAGFAPSQVGLAVPNAIQYVRDATARIIPFLQTG